MTEYRMFSVLFVSLIRVILLVFLPLMKQKEITRLLFFAGLLAFAGCRDRFDAYLATARKAFADENYVEVVDNLNLGLPRWKKSDGNEEKAQAYQLLGQAYRELRKIDKSVDAYQEAIKLSTNTYTAAYNLGVIHLTRNEPNLAAKAFQAALRMRNDDPLSLVGLGNALYAIQEYGQARLTYQRVVEVSPGVRDSLDNIKAIDKKIRAGRGRKRR